MQNKIKVGKYFELSGAWVAVILLGGKFIFALTSVSILTHNNEWAFMFVGLRECYSMFKGWISEGEHQPPPPDEVDENKI